MAGPDTGPAFAPTRAGELIVGARFLPGAGGPALGLPLDEVRDRRVELAELGLAADLGLSERQLRRRFDATVGYGPKTLQRVLRLRRFLSGAQADLGRAALDAGYSDQAHLTRECSRLTGLSPGRWVGSA